MKGPAKDAPRTTAPGAATTAPSIGTGSKTTTATATAIATAAIVVLAGHAALLAPPAAAQLRGVEFRLDNDQFAFTPAREERWYTSGAFLQLAFDAPAGAADSRLAAAACGWLLGCGADVRTMRVASLNHLIFTPAVSAGTPPQPYDRPFAATLAVGLASVAIDPRSRQTLELRVGTLGPSAQGEPVQNGIHRLLGQPEVQGWQYQVRTQPLAQLGGSWLVRRDVGDGLDLVTRAAVLLGTPVTQAGVGAMLRVGNAPAGPTWPGETLGLREPSGWYAFAGAEARAVARDETIEGDTAGYVSQVRRAPWAGTAFAGVSLAASTDWRIELAFALHSIAFTTPVEPAAQRPQWIGTIGLRWQPAR